jgi:hypothetical protein
MRYHAMNAQRYTQAKKHIQDIEQIKTLLDMHNIHMPYMNPGKIPYLSNTSPGYSLS